MVKLDRFSCSQKIQLKWDPPASTMQLTTILILSNLLPLIYYLFGRYITFSLFWLITLEIYKYICIYTQYYCINWHQKYIDLADICSFTSIITYIFFVCRLIAKNYILHVCKRTSLPVFLYAYKHIYRHTYTCTHTYTMHVCLHIYVCTHIDIGTYSCNLSALILTFLNMYVITYIYTYINTRTYTKHICLHTYRLIHIGRQHSIM